MIRLGLGMDISIIVPTLNRASTLANALRSIAKVVGPSEAVEIIIVDNGSTDRTAQVCAGVAEQFPRQQWRYFNDGMPGLLTGRHRGANEARGGILAYLDDDILLAPTWLESLKEAFRDPKVALVGGPSMPVFETEPPSWLEGFWTEGEGGRLCVPLSLIDSGSVVKPANPLYVLGLNYAVRKKTFEELGGFHPDCIPKTLQRYQGDGETGLSFKIKDAEVQCLYHPGVALTHVIPASRLTAAYFEERGFYQGVCDSFTRIRNQGFVDERHNKPFNAALRRLKYGLYRRHLIRRTGKSIRQLVGWAHTAGYTFHQNEVRNDPKLLAWVLRPNYFDYGLPNGWERHMRTINLRHSGLPTNSTGQSNEYTTI